MTETKDAKESMNVEAHECDSLILKRGSTSATIKLFGKFIISIFLLPPSCSGTTWHFTKIFHLGATLISWKVDDEEILFVRYIFLLIK